MFLALVQTLQPNSVNPIFTRGIVKHRNTTISSTGRGKYAAPVSLSVMRFNKYEI